MRHPKNFVSSFTIETSDLNSRCEDIIESPNRNCECVPLTYLDRKVSMLAIGIPFSPKSETANCSVAAGTSVDRELNTSVNRRDKKVKEIKKNDKEQAYLMRINFPRNCRSCLQNTHTPRSE